jgi:hypothetical protein
MHFDERCEGGYRIFAGALESRLGDGYTAALIVNRLQGQPGAPHEVFRDENLACGHRWATPDAALSFALSRGQQLVRKV